MEVKHLRLRSAVDTCQRLVAPLIGIHIGERHTVARFLQQSEAFPQEGGGLALAGRLAQVLALQPHLFLRASPEPIIVQPAGQSALSAAQFTVQVVTFECVTYQFSGNMSYHNRYNGEVIN